MAAMTTCKVYRSDKKAEMYLYLSDGLDFADLPENLQQRFGAPALVMRLELSTERKLARVDVVAFASTLVDKGLVQGRG